MRQSLILFALLFSQVLFSQDSFMDLDYATDFKTLAYKQMYNPKEDSLYNFVFLSVDTVKVIDENTSLIYDSLTSDYYNQIRMILNSSSTPLDSLISLENDRKLYTDNYETIHTITVKLRFNLYNTTKGITTEEGFVEYDFLLKSHSIGVYHTYNNIFNE